MTTITLKFNESTKAGKAVLAMIEFFRESKTIEIIEPEMTDKEIAFLKDLKAGLREAKAIQEGKIKGTSIKDLLNEK